MSKIVQFGEHVDGYQVPVLNEREIRAAAGIMFFFAFLSLLLILFKNEFLLAKTVIYLFFFDFLIRLLINPRFAPSLIIGRIIVGNQKPEYVGAPQKKFSWFTRTSAFRHHVRANGGLQYMEHIYRAVVPYMFDLFIL